MIVAASQPYFAPFAGFFFKALQADVLVLLDGVQFPRKTTWITRNRFKNDQGTLWMTLPVKKKGLGLQPITDVRLHHDGRWPHKHLTSLAHAYARAPYFDDHRIFLERLLFSPAEKLVDLIVPLLHYLMDGLDIGCRIVRQTELGIRTGGTRLLVDVCRELGASQYLAQRPAQKYLQPQTFQDAGLKLQFCQPPALIYPQLWGPFIPNLSVLDLMFNCGPKAGEIIAGSAQEQGRR